MKEILFLNPVFKTAVWGGEKLKTEFGYSIPSSSTGECWAISAHPNGDCTVKSGTFKGKTLSWLWDNHRELFGNIAGEVFPLLVKIIDAKDDLSIQVHPDDTYAKQHENSLGKTECWYILDCEENGEIVIGHKAKNKEELIQMINQNKWSHLIDTRPIKKGDFFQINPGTVHAIKKGTLILETQQNSDITYRLYDYDRLYQGKPRELHIQKSIDVITCPHQDTKTADKTAVVDDCTITEKITCPYYTVSHIKVEGTAALPQPHPFLNVSVISGSGQVEDYPIKKGDHFIIPANFGNLNISGNLELIVSHI